MRHDRHATRDRRHELLEPVEPREVEVVRRFVEQEHVEARKEDRSQGHARGLTARERRRALVERVGRQPDVGEDHPDPSLEVGATEREPPFERGRVQVVPALVARGERIRRPCEGLLGIGHPGAPVEQRPHRLAVAPLGFLGEVADGRGRGRELHGATLRVQLACEQAQQCRLPAPVVADHAHPGPGTDRQGHAVEDHCVGPSEPERVRDQRRAHRVSRGGRDATRRADRTTPRRSHTPCCRRGREEARPRARCLR